MNVVFEQIQVGGDRNLGYLLGDRNSRQAVLVDPSYSPQMLVERAKAQQLVVTHIINTHGHSDHTNGNAAALRATGAKLLAHPHSVDPAATSVADGEELAVGSLRLKFYHAPGHCADHVVIHEQVHDLLLTGDLLFVGKIGGTGADEDARIEWDTLRRLLKIIPETATVWPGHDYGARPASTLKLELASNPFLRCKDFADFLRLKETWADFKREHGLR